jgi:glycosyltransferase involved in cell wall biosynthesis
MLKTQAGKDQAKKKILYISYDGILEPLGHSQVLKYLAFLSKDFHVTLISFEKINSLMDKKELLEMHQYCQQEKINWKPRTYHQGLPLFSHLANFFSILYAPFIEMLKNAHQIVHIRSYMPGLGVPLFKIFFNFKLVFDIRGFWADEKVDRLGWSKNSLKYKFIKALEVKLFKQASIIVTLTRSSKEFIEDKFNKLPNDVRVVRTCVDFTEFNTDKRALMPYDFHRKLVIGYLGSIDTAYDFNLFLKLIKDLERRDLKIKLKILSKTTPEIVMQYLEVNNLSHLEHEVLFLKRHDLSSVINQFDLLGFALKPSFSLIASMPTKIAESLACGTPIICNNFNNDIRDMIEINKIGVLYDFSQNLRQENYEEIISIIQDDTSSERCYEFSKENFSLELGVSQYVDIYNSLL